VPNFPTFVIIGAMKSGTTSLYNLLRRHDEINMCLVKEPNFFNVKEDTRGNWELGEEWYRNLFEPRPGLTGEASSNYTKFPSTLGVAERLHRINPDSRLVYIVRNPVDRILSHYLHKVIRGTEKRPIHAALKSTVSDYLLISMYYLQLQQYLQFFPSEQICVIAAEAMWRNPSADLERLCDFLKISRLRIPKDLHLQAGATVDTLQSYHFQDSLNDAQELVWTAMHTIIESGDASAKAFGVALGFGLADQKRLASRLIHDVRLFYNFLGHSIEDWKGSFDL
jgi:hypothetical protein